MSYISDLLLIGVDFSESDIDTLVVGRKLTNESVEIINVFQYEGARALYDTLTNKKEAVGDE